MYHDTGLYEREIQRIFFRSWLYVGHHSQIPQRGDYLLFEIAGESLIVVYRILFLLFAEARGLVPKWHPTYRDSYTIEALRTSVEMASPARGVGVAAGDHRPC